METKTYITKYRGTWDTTKAYKGYGEWVCNEDTGEWSWVVDTEAQKAKIKKTWYPHGEAESYQVEQKSEYTEYHKNLTEKTTNASEAGDCPDEATYKDNNYGSEARPAIGLTEVKNYIDEAVKHADDNHYK